MRRAPRPCKEPGCPDRAEEDGHCPTHRKAGRKHLDSRRPSSRQRGYDKRHEAWRQQVLERDPICKHCGTAPSTEADHITPITQGGERYDLANGQGLCKPCHSRKTARQGRWG